MKKSFDNRPTIKVEIAPLKRLVDITGELSWYFLTKFYISLKFEDGKDEDYYLENFSPLITKREMKLIREIYDLVFFFRMQLNRKKIK